MTFEEFERRIRTTCSGVKIRHTPIAIYGGAEIEHGGIILTLYGDEGENGGSFGVEAGITLKLISQTNRALNLPELVAERLMIAVRDGTGFNTEIKSTDLKVLLPVRLIGA